MGLSLESTRKSYYPQLKKQLKIHIENERRLRLLVDNLPARISYVNTDQRFVFVNSRYEKAFGLTRNDMVGKTIETVIGQENYARAKHHIQDALRGKEVTYQTPFKGRKGDTQWLEVTYIPDIHSQGDVSGFYALSLDLTEKKLAEASLRESEGRLKAIFKANPNPVVVYDAQGFTQDLNPAFTETFGWSLDEVKGRRIPFVPEDQKETTAAKIEEIYRSGKPVKFLNKRLTKKGGTIDVIVSAALIKGHKGKVSGMTVNLIDISEQKKLENQLKQAQKMESVGRLAGGIAHDFNNMLGVILGYAELAMKDLDPTSPVYSNLKEIDQAAKRSANLTRQLLAFARRQTAVPKVIDLNETISGMITMLRRLIGEDIDLAWTPGANPWPVKIDPAQIDQILANLCVNARDAIANVGKITIGTRNVVLDKDYCETKIGCAPGQYMMLAVSDNGTGMDRQTLEQIFDPFYTTKGIGAGTGLGLSTVYGIVKQNDGFIDVYSEPGEGTSFKVYLPATDETIRPMEKSNIQTVATGSETVLVVEDEESILRFCSDVLKKFGYTILSARTPFAAIELTERHPNPIHLMITDVVMPEMNGNDLKTHIEKVLPGIKVLFMSGYTADVIMHRGILEENMHFLQKPFSVHSLAAKVREVLDEVES